MKIGIIGATGNVGQIIYKEAIARDNDVTALVRNSEKAKKLLGNNVNYLEKDALLLSHDDLKDFDVIIDAFASPDAYRSLDLTGKLVALFRGQHKPHLIFVTDSSSLKNKDGVLQLADILKQFADQPWIQSSVEQNHSLDLLKWVDNVDWTVMTPQNDFVPGDKTNYRLGTDSVMKDRNGNSKLSYGNFASAMLDESENPQHIHQQFTVVND